MISSDDPRIHDENHWPTTEEMQDGFFRALFEARPEDWRLEDVCLTLDDLAAHWRTDRETVESLWEALRFYHFSVTLDGHVSLSVEGVRRAEREYPELREGRFLDAVAREVQMQRQLTDVAFNRV